MNTERPRIVLSEVIKHLENGVTRLKSDSAYNAERGSIEEIYKLSGVAVKELFKHPVLVNKRVRVPKEPEFILIDDVTEQEETLNNQETSDSPETPESQESQESPEVVMETTTIEDSNEDPLF